MNGEVQLVLPHIEKGSQAGTAPVAPSASGPMLKAKK